jgi:hypothetical protein
VTWTFELLRPGTIEIRQETALDATKPVLDYFMLRSRFITSYRLATDLSVGPGGPSFGERPTGQGAQLAWRRRLEFAVSIEAAGAGSN